MKCAITDCQNKVNGFHYYKKKVYLNKDKTGQLLTVHTIVETYPEGEGVCEYHTVRGGTRMREDYEEDKMGEK